MLLSIDESKIAELLKSGDKGYTVENMPIPRDGRISAENLQEPAYPTTTAVTGAIYGSTLIITEETKEHLMSLRRKIEESGVPLKSADELSKEIDEMRRRR